MDSNIYIIVVIIVVVVTSLITVLNNTYIFKRDIVDITKKNKDNIEHFTNKKLESCNMEEINSYFSSDDVKNIKLPKSQNISLNPKPIEYKDDIEGPLIRYKKVSMENVEQIIEDISGYCYVSTITQELTHMNEVYQKVIDDLDKSRIKLNAEYINSPIYIIVCKDIPTKIYGELNIDLGVNKYNTTIYIIYSKYYSDCQNNYKILEQKNNDKYTSFTKYMKNLKSTGNCDMYILNSKNKMFYNLV